MRRWVLRSVFNVILFSSALVVTSLFILQHQASLTLLQAPAAPAQPSYSAGVGNNNNNNAGAGLQSKLYFSSDNRNSNRAPNSDYYVISTPEQIADDEYAGEPPPQSSSITNDADKQQQQIVIAPTTVSKDKSFATINCEINGEYSIECLFYKNAVYFPFEFLAKYFEVYGHFKVTDNNNNNVSTIITPVVKQQQTGVISAAANKKASAAPVIAKQQLLTFQFEHSNTGHGFGGSPMLNETYLGQHDCDGAFMNFASFNVERRNKVKFISVANGVPLSIQWDTTHRGYHFATQVAQFGLSYYSKLVNRRQHQQQAQQAVQIKFHPNTEGEGGRTGSNSDCYADQSIKHNNFLKFSCKSFDSPIRVPISVDDSPLSLQKFPILNLTYEFTTSNGALSFELQMDVVLPSPSQAPSSNQANNNNNQQQAFSRPTSKQLRSIQRAISSTKTRRLLVQLSYRCQNGVDDVTSRFIGTTSSSKSTSGLVMMVEIVYSIPKCPSLIAQSIYRYLLIDVLKGLHVLPSEAPSYLRKLPHTDLTLASIDGVKLSGTGAILGAVLLQQADREFALLAADWLVQNQTPDGGWPIPIGRQLLSGDLRLEPGWHDAMAQGQGMSLLVRAYKLTAHPAYAVAALRAILPFNVAANKNGVVNRLFDKFDWYEEYPTTPGLFVLNGFIYSLIGLYDTATCLSPPNVDGDDKFFQGAIIKEAHNDLLPLLTRTRELFTIGLQTLRQTLPLFDTGYATFYDLRHLSLPGTQPNVARWDYHDAHVRQLYLLAKIDVNLTNNNESANSNIWLKTAKRWYGYMRGIRAPHN